MSDFCGTWRSQKNELRNLKLLVDLLRSENAQLRQQLTTQADSVIKLETELDLLYNQNRKLKKKHASRHHSRFHKVSSVSFEEKE